MKRLNLVGQVFDRLTVVGDAAGDLRGNSMWVCHCSCGSTVVVSASNLRRKGPHGCGCLNRLDLYDQQFGRLVVIARGDRDRWGTYYWICRCFCGQTVTVRGSALRSGEIKSCGCLWQDVRRLQRGERSPAWKGGRTPEILLARASKAFKQWRAAVFKRDRYTCQSCGDHTGGNLHAHHIRPFAEDLAGRFDVQNGLTLCRPCHERLHNKPIPRRRRVRSLPATAPAQVTE